MIGTNTPHMELLRLLINSGAFSVKKCMLRNLQVPCVIKSGPCMMYLGDVAMYGLDYSLMYVRDTIPSLLSVL